MLQGESCFHDNWALLTFCHRYALAIDYTGRNLQDQLKGKGLPWTKAKGFDDSCPIGPFIPSSEIKDPHALQLWLKVRPFPLSLRGAVR